MTRKFFSVTIMLLLTSMLQAQAPQRFSYQAIIRNASGALLGNQSIGMRVSILKKSATGTASYVETHATSTNAQGLVNLEIGGGTVVSGSMSGINWGTDTFFIKTETDPAGGTNYTLVSSTSLKSVPYAMHAATSGNGLTNGTSNNQIMYWNGSSWVALNPGTNGQVLTICNGVLTWTSGGLCATALGECQTQNYLNPSISYGVVYDQEGNKYKTVKIGIQEWMAENIRTSIYRNGDIIPNVSNSASWTSLTSGASCWYNNDSAKNHCSLGKMYNWFAVADQRRICPIGWHVPSDSELTILTDFLGGELVSGGKMKSSSGWNGNTNGSNTSGFSALAGGYRAENGQFELVGDIGYWWSATSEGQGRSWVRYIGSNNNVSRLNGFWGVGRSVRCIKDLF
jgi:uncharacterized protein (TIGR02145 family)